MNGPSNIGARLYALLPAVYRSRDNAVRGADGRVQSPGDLARYLDACGLLLDAVKATLDQRLADAFPDNAPPGERSCQDWLLPYFADLLDVRLVSPEVEGRRNEIANAVAWRQRKGTVSVVEAVAESVGRVEAEVQEGWRRVALTARVGMPLLPASAYGAGEDVDTATAPPSRVARHPGLPAVTPDLRRASRAVRTDPANPAAKLTRYGDGSAYWRLAHPHGAPCFAGSYEDASRRTVDLRAPDWRRGHSHPRRVLLFLPPAAGFFGADPVRIPWAERGDPESADLIAIEEMQRDGPDGVEQVVVHRGTGERPVCIEGPIAISAAGAPAPVYRFENLCLDGGVAVDGARLELVNCAVRHAAVNAAGGEAPALDARGTLLGAGVCEALVRLEHCTVLATLAAGALQASDCIFTGSIAAHPASPPAGIASCVRYSRVPAAGNAFDADTYAPTCTVERAVFYADAFGEHGCAVLHPASPEAVRFGAEDGGELGAFHDRHHCLRWAAIHDKLDDYLPVGQKNALIPDVRLLRAPPRTAGP